MRSLAVLIVFMPALAAANQCQFTAQHDFDIDAAGLKTVAFMLGSNDVYVEGVPGLTKVEVRGRACASDQDWLAGLGVDQERSGDRVTLTPKSERSGSWHWFGSSYAYVDLRVRVPTTLAIDIRSVSGDASVKNVSALAFNGSSGDLDVDRIAGALVVKLSSGDVKGRDIGSVDLDTTSSGDVELSDVRGDVHVGRAGSGDLHFNKVDGSVAIGKVGSGDIVLGQIGHDARIDSIGSGDVSASDIGGDFTVSAKGSGDIGYHDVRGSVSVPRERD